MKNDVKQYSKSVQVCGFFITASGARNTLGHQSGKPSVQAQDGDHSIACYSMHVPFVIISAA